MCPHCGSGTYSGPAIHSYETAAREVSLSPDFLKKEVAAGRLGFKKIGRRTLIPHTELMSWFNSYDSGPMP